VWVKIGSDIKGVHANGVYGRNVLSEFGNIVAISSMTSDDNGVGSGHIEMHKEQNGQWVQMGDNIAGEHAGDNFGGSIALSSDGFTVAAGAIYANNDSESADTGHVRAFQYVNESWSQIGSDIDGIRQNDLQFTVSLSSDGTIMAVGAYGNDGPSGNKINSGSASIYKKIEGEWVQMGETIYGELSGDNLGAVGLSSKGTVLAIGSFLANNGAGQVNLFDYNETTSLWTKSSAVIVGNTNNDNIGATIAISSDGTFVATSSRNIGYIAMYKIASLVNNNNNVLKTSDELIQEYNLEIRNINNAGVRSGETSVSIDDIIKIAILTTTLKCKLKNNNQGLINILKIKTPAVYTTNLYYANTNAYNSNLNINLTNIFNLL